MPARTRSSTRAATDPCGACEMTEAYRSALDISFDVRAGLVMRQIHHWAALLFVAAMVVHLCRVFFTGAFRRPRELNWIIGVTHADPRHPQRIRRLLAARRPALGHRVAHRLLDRAQHPRGRHVADLAGVRRRVPRTRHHQPAVRDPHPARPGRDHRAADRAPGARRAPQAHPVPRARAARTTTWSASGPSPPTRPRASGSSSSPRRCSRSSADWWRSTRSGSTARSCRPT